MRMKGYGWMITGFLFASMVSIDQNSDGEITFSEAYLHEVEILENYGQYPEKW